MKTKHIYVLYEQIVSEITGEFIAKIRYVGITCNWNTRLKSHIDQAFDSRSKKNLWIQSLLVRDEEPEMVWVADVLEDAKAEEKFWIKTFEDCGCNLTNTYPGGNGSFDRPPEVGQKISKSQTGRKHSEYTKNLMRLAALGRESPCKGKPKTAEHKQKLREAALARPSRPGIPHTEISKAKIRKARSEQVVTKKHASNISKGHLGKDRKKTYVVTEDLIRMIYEDFKYDYLRVLQLARKYNVPGHFVRRIVTKVNWLWLTDKIDLEYEKAEFVA